MPTIKYTSEGSTDRLVRGSTIFVQNVIFNGKKLKRDKSYSSYSNLSLDRRISDSGSNYKITRDKKRPMRVLKLPLRISLFLLKSKDDEWP